MVGLIVRRRGCRDSDHKKCRDHGAGTRFRWGPVRHSEPSAQASCSSLNRIVLVVWNFRDEGVNASQKLPRQSGGVHVLGE